MKNIIIYTFLLFGTIFTASAQKDVEAKKILDPVSQKYKSYKTIKSEFSFTLENSMENVKQTQNGVLITETKTNKYKISLYAPDAAKPEIEQEIISNGKNQWTYNKKDKEVELSAADNSGAGFNPAQLFTIYEHGYKYLYTGEQRQGGIIYQVIDLTPESDKIQFFKIRLMIDKIKKQIYSALIFDKSGSKYNYILKTFTPNIPVTDDTFTYDAKAHPGVEVVDLR